MTGHQVGFTRWYDRIPELSQAVRGMEHAEPAYQHLISTFIVASIPMSHVVHRQELGVKKLGTEKVLGLMKAKKKDRWYDQDPTVHQAFNLLYLMDERLRFETAVRILLSLKALQAAERQEASAQVQRALVARIFGKPIQDLLEQVKAGPNLSDLDDTTPLPPTHTPASLELTMTLTAETVSQAHPSQDLRVTPMRLDSASDTPAE